MHVPTDEMLLFGKKLHAFIQSKWKAPHYYYHMRDGGHLLAARVHINSEYFCLVDIRSFFESTSQSRVTRELKTIIPYAKAREIAKISTVRVPNRKDKKFSVPYGFPQSPILATLCFHNSYAGRFLSSIYKSGLVRVSIYMDDIILSSNDLEILLEQFRGLCESLSKSRYDINQAKTQLPADVITVFNLELSKQNLKITSKRMVEFIKAYVRSDNEFERAGIATYVHTVNPRQANNHFPKKVTYRPRA